jgi:predicted P-loop ATPase
MKFNGKHSSAFNYISSKYRFRFNVVTNLYEYAEIKKGKKKKKPLKWIKYDDRKKNSILLELLKEHHDRTPTEKVNIFIESEDVSPDYNPFDEYFENLPKWDGKTDYIKQLSKTITVEEQKRFKKILKKFLVGSVHCLLNPKSVNDVCLVFQSPQGLGKTRWMRSLLPKQFRAEYLYEGTIDTRNKDHNIYLSQYWFIHLDELEALRGNAIESIKSYITREMINERKAYGRYTTKFTRRASFLGSVNADKFLSDTTGNRRWLVFKTLDINYQHDVDVNGLWSQVYSLYKDKFKHWFDTEEIKDINKGNEKFREVSLEEEMILRFFTFNQKKGEGEYLSSSEVIQKVIINIPQFNNKLTSFRMGKALSKHCKEKRMTNGIQTYFVNYHGQESGEVFSPSPNAHRKNEKIGEDDDLPF